MTPFTFCATCALLALSTFSFATFAQQMSGREACRQDIERFCSGPMPRGGPQIKDCLWDNARDISDVCYDALNSKSPLSGNSFAAPQRSAPSNGRAVYRARQANGNTVYSDVPPPEDASAQPIRLTNGNTAWPPR